MSPVMSFVVPTASDSTGRRESFSVTTYFADELAESITKCRAVLPPAGIAGAVVAAGVAAVDVVLAAGVLPEVAGRRVAGTSAPANAVGISGAEVARSASSLRSV